MELDYDNYNQVPESPIGRDEEPHLYMVPKKYRKVGLNIFVIGFHIKALLEKSNNPLLIICLLLLCVRICLYPCAGSGHN